MFQFMNMLKTSVAATEPVVEEAAPELFFEPSGFVDKLSNMGIGMLVIFVVIGIIILTTMMINKVFSE